MTNPIGVHAMVWTGSTSGPELARAVEQTSASGFDLIEFTLMQPSEIDIATVRAALSKHGVSATGSLGLTAETDISSDDENAVARGEALLQDAVRVVAELGGTDLCGVIYSALQKYERPPTLPGRKNSVEALHRLAEFARQRGVRLSLEVVNRYETNLINTARDCLTFLDEVDHPNVAVHLDTYHMNIEEDSMDRAVEAVGTRLGYVHVGESHRGYLGTGTVDFPTFFAALGRLDYAGPIVFESFSAAVVGQRVSNRLGVWRNLWDDSADLASHARDFLRTALADSS